MSKAFRDQFLQWLSAEKLKAFTTKRTIEMASAAAPSMSLLETPEYLAAKARYEAFLEVLAYAMTTDWSTVSDEWAKIGGQNG